MSRNKNIYHFIISGDVVCCWSLTISPRLKHFWCRSSLQARSIILWTHVNNLCWFIHSVKWWWENTFCESLPSPQGFCIWKQFNSFGDVSIVEYRVPARNHRIMVTDRQLNECCQMVRPAIRGKISTLICCKCVCTACLCWHYQGRIKPPT